MTDPQHRGATRRRFLQSGAAVAAAATVHGNAWRAEAAPAAAGAAAPAPVHPLRSPFIKPPQDWAPRVWWHWMSPNITEDGITKDLDWFKRSGIGGFHQFTGDGSRSPVYVDEPVVYMTPEFKQAFTAAIAGAAERDLEATLSSSAGWSITGAPFVQGVDGMKKYVWTETWVDGGAPVQVALPQPPSTIGKFGDVSVVQRSQTPSPPLYEDAHVFAYRVANGARPQAQLAPSVFLSAYSATATGTPTTNGATGVQLAAPEVAKLSNDSVTDPFYVPGTEAWVRFEFPQALTVGGLSVAEGDDFAGWVFLQETGKVIEVEASQDNQTWTRVGGSVLTGVQRSITLDETTARYYRVRWTQGLSATRPIALAKLVLRPVPTVDKWEHKAGFGSVGNFYTIDTPDGGMEPVPGSAVVDLTDAMAADGTLTWDAPAGTWVVVRLGFGLTGAENRPTTPAATGLEVDKLDPARVRAYLNTYLDEFTETLPADLIGEGGLSGLLCDSYEAGYQTWTEALVEEFVERRGYDPVPWFPVLVGTVVTSAAASDKFLWDWRTTLADMLAEHHYGVIHDVVHERGLSRFVSQAQEDKRGFFGDDTAMRRHADIPMGASRSVTETLGGTVGEQYRLDVKGASSIAHVYGRSHAACETLTLTRGQWTPRDAKPFADQLLVAGVTQFVVHSADHQPLDGGPGSTLNGIGWFMNRNQTWAEQAKALVEWMGRTSGLLNQGVNVADVAYFYGQEAPLSGQWQEPRQPDVPLYHYYDFIDREMLLNEFTIKDGALVTSTGQSYRLLYLGGMSDRVTLDVLRKIKYVVESGVAVAGPKPTMSPSLADNDRAFQRLATEIWGDGTETSRRVGRGVVMTGLDPDEALERVGVARDFSFLGGRLTFVHRRTDDLEVYFVVNDDHVAAVETTISLRATADAAELWDAVSGRAWLSSFTTQGGRTELPLSLGPAESVFVVLRKGAGGAASPPAITESALAAQTGSWSLTFDPPRGTPAQLELAQLQDLTTRPEVDVKHYSGTTVYRTTLDVASDQAALDGARLLLDLGQVNEIAEVSLNGVVLDTIAWRAPYRIDVSGRVRPGPNDLEVRVTNIWWNRIVGDLQPGVTTTYASRPDNATFGASATAALLPSGLVGPVALVAETGRQFVGESPVTPPVTPPETPPGTGLRSVTAPAVTGTARVGATLTADPGTWSPAAASYAYQWTRNGAPVPGATAPTYALGPSEVNTLIAVTVAASAPGRGTTTAPSAGVLVGPGVFAAAVPVVKGRARVGHKVTTVVSGWSPKPTRVEYRWYLDGEPVRGARRRRYSIRRRDRGKRLKVRVTVSAPGYAETSRSSRALVVGNAQEEAS